MLFLLCTPSITLFCSGYMVSCLVQRPKIGPVIRIMVILPFLIFGGLYINSDMVPVYFEWLEYMSPIKYVFRGLSRAYWSFVASIPCATKPACIALTAGDMLLLLAINLLFRTLGGIALSFRLRHKHH
ncbi:ATP-binding Cassette (ABC) Superfamily [Thraustotheca clavata]|uniref:ATP-binding Cassette (ABC) Superfamily n=1 Tax=Thraustotheca clavata TaxID=74557 RepID=A0A1V9Z6T4_9STRA|nr:ATP-binding Cassette (ABC) Superfamily [Thraustotheca clavata]